MIRTKKQGMLIVLSGPSGCGKGSIIKEFLKQNKNTWLSVSATSRSPREGEIDGESYYFLTKEEFEEKIKEGAFLEYAMYAGNYYGTFKKAIEEKLSLGMDVLLEIEIQGALKIKELLKETIFIFVLPPSMNELRKRLEGRNTEDKEKQEKRFQRAYEEINAVSKYNYVIVNDEIQLAAKKMEAILIAERLRVDRIEEVLLETKEEDLHLGLLNTKNVSNIDLKEKISTVMVQKTKPRKTKVEKKK